MIEPIPEWVRRLSFDGRDSADIVRVLPVGKGYYVFFSDRTFLAQKKSWLSRKWTAVKKWLQTFWNVGWELPK